MIKPIIFSTDGVRAIVDGRKVMTRRVISQNIVDRFVISKEGQLLGSYQEKYIDCYPTVDDCRYNPGDVLWVREKWRTVDYEYCDGKWSASVEYAGGIKGPRVFWYDNSDVGIPYDGIYSTIGWRSPIYMPREAARLFLRVTDVRAERLQEISDADAWSEGVDLNDVVDMPCRPDQAATTVYSGIWEHINAKRGYGWETNPWVWVITFERCEKPEGWLGRR